MSGQWDNDSGLSLKNLTAAGTVSTQSFSLGGTSVTASAAAINAAATAATAAVVAVPISLVRLSPSGAMKDQLPDAPNATSLGLADAAGSAVVGTTTNSGGTNSATETCAFEYALPASYVAGSAITLRIRAKVSVARTTTQTIGAVVKTVADGALGSDINATAAQSVTAAYANYDFTITPTGLVPGTILNVAITAINTAGVASDGFIAISRIEMRPTTLT
jgi:hypothetical protein